MLESLSKDVADQKASSFIKQRLQHRCFLVNIAKIFKNIYFEEHLQMTASGKLLHNKTPLYFLRTETDFLFVQEDSSALTDTL